MTENQKQRIVDNIADKVVKWIGSPGSILVHTLFFVGIFVLRLFDVATDDILLILTTVVSLEAIYLSIFIQRTVNQQGEAIEDVEEALEETEADHNEIVSQTVKKLEKPLDEIVAEIREDVKELLEEHHKTKHI